jgi:hypothetical protein
MLPFWSVIVRFLATSKIRPGTAREVRPIRKAASDPLVPLVKTQYKFFHNHLVSPLQLHHCHIMSSSSSSSSDTDDVVLASSYNKKTITSLPGTTFCPAKVRYRSKNQSLKILVTLCRGLKDDNGHGLLDFKSYPWVKLKATHVKPTNVGYVEEIHRRFDVMKSLLEDPLLLGVAPQPKGWNTEKLVGWLDTHPVDGVEDVDYLTRIVANS